MSRLREGRFYKEEFWRFFDSDEPTVRSPPGRETNGPHFCWWTLADVMHDIERYEEVVRFAASKTLYKALVSSRNFGELALGTSFAYRSMYFTKSVLWFAKPFISMSLHPHVEKGLRRILDTYEWRLSQ